MSTITYTNGRDTYRDIPLGQDYSVKREPGDIVLERAVAVDLPIVIAIQIKADGTIAWWHTDTNETHNNHYWHFAHLSPQGNQCTPLQRVTLNLMQSGELDIYGMRGALGGPVIEWAFGEESARIAAAYRD